MQDKSGKTIGDGARVQFSDAKTGELLTGKVISFDGENLLTVEARRTEQDPLGPFQLHANQVTVLRK